MIHGDYASVYDFPYLVYFGNDHYICSGVIVSRSCVLTAAHCVRGDPDKLIIRSGSDLRKSGGSVHQIDSIVIHENYALDRFEQSSVFDIAVVRVVQPFVYSSACQPIELFHAWEETKAGSRSLVSGWGKVRLGEEFPDKLRKMSLVVVDKHDCHKSYASWGGIHPGQICAKNDDPVTIKSPCYGDSGGPLVIGGRLASIFVYGGECELPGSPVVCTEVAFLRDWIDKRVDYDD